ncbi:hypothetical protein SCHPADRAFT_515258 [Schizopora paradoxa]|uniref:Uncharacterized protein n=1 Tax=Schizopora paradoxa TaxID=27342 RepID=A0A0H2RG35_9AGAM|nr:hypothetical protein SCHPADRAFT_515258 [Schizopora paradoxa]
MARSSRNVGTDELDGRSGYAWLAMWVDAFKLHQFLRRTEFQKYSKDHPLVCKPWGELCHESLPNPEHAKLRQILLRLEDIYGFAICNRFPPEKGSAIDRGQKYFAYAKRPIPGLRPCTHCSNPRELVSDLRRTHWKLHSWYDDQLRICEEMVIFIESSTFLCTSSAGIPYAISLGQAAPNACNVCYRALPRRSSWESPTSPIVVMLTYHRGILSFFVLRVNYILSIFDDDDKMLESFDGGFRFNRKDAISFAYVE